jgi:hypothetical protein
VKRAQYIDTSRAALVQNLSLYDDTREPRRQAHGSCEVRRPSRSPSEHLESVVGGHVPAHAQDNDLPVEVAALEHRMAATTNHGDLRRGEITSLGVL